MRNDGQGSPIAASSTSATVTVAAAVSGTIPLPPTVSFAVPEPFVPVISENPDVYGGKHFLVFSATDKGSGIDHYEVLEVPTGRHAALPSSSWQVATSPYLLQDQNLSSDIYVRAVDHAGNAIVVKVPAQYPAASAAGIDWALLGCVCIGILLCVAIFMLRRRRMLR